MKVGSLFTGAGGLDLAVETTFCATTSWVADVEPGPRKILAHRYADVPNLGDVTAVDWEALEPVDVICGGSPCQDLSQAGRRRGMRAGTRSGLWASMLAAIATIRPSYVVWENVRGALSACAHSELEPCPGCVGDGPHQPVLRALGRVLGDLADVGYDAQWCGLRAADVGAPHGRFRVFVLAWPAADTPHLRHQWARTARDGRAGSEDCDQRSVALLPTPTTRDEKGPNQRGDDTCLTGALLPTPRATDGTKGGPNQRGSSGDLMLPAAVHLIPTPLASDAGPRGGTSGFGLRDWSRSHKEWGRYGDAVHRWETITGHSAPSPTEPSSRGTQRLSPRFTEWMMGWPAGWVTDVPGLSRNDQLKACGNGVVPQQAQAALQHMQQAAA